jgi:hypothetical protein
MTSGGGDMKTRFMAMDQNRDGKVSLVDEVPQHFQQYVKRLDTNQDGFIDKKEMDAAPMMPAGSERGKDAVTGNPQNPTRPESQP